MTQQASDRAPEYNAVFPPALAKLGARFLSVRAATDALAAPLSPEDAQIQSMPDVSPTKWHLAHTTWFFETFLLEPLERNFAPFDASFRVLFNSYYNGVGAKHPRAERGAISRPTLQDVKRYRENVTTRMIDLLKTQATTNAKIVELTWLGCNHEEQHQELILTDIKHVLSRNPAKPAYQPRWPLTAVEPRHAHWIGYDGGLVEIGHNGNEFAFDNESPRHKVWLEPFELASHPVTHGEYLQFVEAGGYAQPEWWLSLGWDWVNANKIDAPFYWKQHNGVWHTFTLHGMVPIEANTPICHLSYFEADAYARWRAATDPHSQGARLPREAEWEHAAQQLSIQSRNGNFLGSRALHPLALREEHDAAQPAQMFGDVWEWTQSSYAAYPGFAPAGGAVGEYNGKFMCNQYVLRGGSCATPQAHIRASYRNFFPPDARWQFTGLRLARDLR
jgi:ergothioneine biosynthesis protein EgtB